MPPAPVIEQVSPATVQSAGTVQAVPELFGLNTQAAWAVPVVGVGQVVPAHVGEQKLEFTDESSLQESLRTAGYPRQTIDDCGGVDG